MIDRGLRAMEWWFQREGYKMDLTELRQRGIIDPERDGVSTEKMRTFDTGATRDSEEGKADYEGFLSPLVVARFGEYMDTHQIQSDGAVRASDNWQKGIPLHAYIKSGFRHFLDWWRCHRGFKTGVEEALCALMFNVMGYLHVVLVEKRKGEEKKRKELLERLQRGTQADVALGEARRDLMRDFE